MNCNHTVKGRAVDDKGMDSSARKPKDTEYRVEKTYHIAPYLGAFGAYSMPQ